MEAALSDEEISHVIGMAWKDDVPFEAIEARYGLDEDAVVALMRSQLKRSSWKLWRERVSGRPTKHASQNTLSKSESRRPPGARSPDRSGLGSGGPESGGPEDPLDPDDLPRNLPLSEIDAGETASTSLPAENGDPQDKGE
ncbi:MAG: TIGR03643 family protein [Bacteroidetes bacterium QH_2_63_10]|nr:MAG: TIGR03643 family protein [Bacteroidetes bacterium QH_2_63_10]